MKKTWKIPVSWSMMGTICVEADTLAEAISIAESDSSIPLPCGYYIDDSWQVDDNEDEIRAVYNDNQEDSN